MDTSIKEKPMADLRDYLAEERSFSPGFARASRRWDSDLWWLTSAFRERAPRDEPRAGVQPQELSLWFGTALIAIGVTVNLFFARRYMRLFSTLDLGQFVHRSPLQARPDCGLVTGAARHRHVDLHDPDPGTAAERVACVVHRNADWCP
jgi:inner membrane protein YidH